MLRPDPNAPKPNKRFLSSIIRNTDEHNKSVLRAQAEAAQEAKAEREEQERKERRKRALEATEAGRLRRLLGSSSHDRWDPSRDRKRRERKRETNGDNDSCDEDRHRSRRSTNHSHSDSRERDSDRHRRRGRYEDDKREGSSRRRSRSRTPDSRKRRDRERDRDRGEGSSKRKHSRSRSKTPERSHRKRHREKELIKTDEVGESDNSSSRKDKGKGVDYSQSPSTNISGYASPMDEDPKKPTDPLSRKSPVDLSSQFKMRKSLHKSSPPPESPTLSEEEDIERFRPRRRVAPPAEPSILPASTDLKTLSSKMDKYFEESYDPRLDIGHMTIPEIPKTGLIDDLQFESWDAVLEVVRQRREDKAERKRLQRLGLLPDKDKKEKKSKDKTDKTEKPSTDAWTMGTGTSIMDIQYSKKGAVREWDMGKEGF